MTDEQLQSEEVHIIGLGAQTSLGRTMMSSWAAVRGGIARLAVHPVARDSTGRSVTVSRAPYLATDMPFLDRIEELFVQALIEAIAPLTSLSDRNEPSVPLILGLPAPRSNHSNGYEREIVARLQNRIESISPIMSIESIPSGHASGLMAIERARQYIIDGVHSICIVGGVDSATDRPSLQYLEERGQLFTTRTPMGQCPGEGAGVCLLASADVARKLGSLGLVEAVATTTGSSGEGAPSPTLTDLWTELLSALPDDQVVSQTFCDLNGEPTRASEFSASIMATTTRLKAGFAYLAPASWWGDVGAASGPLLVGLAIADGLMGLSKGPHTLVCTTSDGGERSAAIISN